MIVIDSMNFACVCLCVCVCEVKFAIVLLSVDRLLRVHGMSMTIILRKINIVLLFQIKISFKFLKIIIKLNFLLFELKN